MIFILYEKKQNEIDSEIAKLIREELSRKVKVIKKYCGFDEKSNIIITFEQAKLINIDFNQFYMNWSNYDGSSKLNNKKNNKLEDKYANENDKKFPFSPHINDNSNKMYQGYRQKIREVIIIINCI